MSVLNALIIIIPLATVIIGAASVLFEFFALHKEKTEKHTKEVEVK